MSNPNDVRNGDPVNRAVALMKAGEAGKAREILFPLTKTKSPFCKKASIQMGYAQALAVDGYNKEAANHLEGFIQKNGLFYDKPNVHEMYVTFLSAAGESDKALRHIDLMMEKNMPLHKHAMAPVTRAMILNDMGRFEEAVRDLEEGILLNPQLRKSAPAHIMLCEGYLGMADPWGALSHARDELKAGPLKKNRQFEDYFVRLVGKVERAYGMKILHEPTVRVRPQGGAHL